MSKSQNTYLAIALAWISVIPLAEPNSQSEALRPLRQVEQLPDQPTLETRRAWFQRLLATIRPVVDEEVLQVQVAQTGPSTALVMPRRRAVQLASAGAVALGLNPTEVLTRFAQTPAVAIPHETFAQQLVTFLLDEGYRSFLLDLSAALHFMREALQAPTPDKPTVDDWAMMIKWHANLDLKRRDLLVPLPTDEEWEILRQFFTNPANLQAFRGHPLSAQRLGARRRLLKKYWDQQLADPRWTQVPDTIKKELASLESDEAYSAKVFSDIPGEFKRIYDPMVRDYQKVLTLLSQPGMDNQQVEAVHDLLRRLQDEGPGFLHDPVWMEEQQERSRQFAVQRLQELEVPPTTAIRVREDLSLAELMMAHSGPDGSLELHLVWQQGELYEATLIRQAPQPDKWALSARQRWELEALWPAEVPQPESAVMSIPFEPQSDWLAVLHRLRVAFELISSPAATASEPSGDALLAAL